MAPLVAAVCVSAVVAVLFRPAFIPGGVPEGDFHGAQVWCFDQMLQFDALTSRLGWPMQARATFVGWVPALVAAPFALFGPPAHYLASIVLTPALSTFAGWWLLRRFDVPSPAAAALGAALAVSPFVLGALSVGQIEKAQIWVVVLPLAALSAALRTPRVVTVLGFGVATAMAFLTAPSVSAHLPYGLVAVGVYELVRSPTRGKAVAAGAGCVVLALAVVVLAHAYFRPDLTHVVDPEIYEAFRPAHPSDDATILLQAVLRLDELWTRSAQGMATFGHVFYLGVALSLAALAGLRRHGGTAVGLALVAVGLVIGAGEVLYWDGQPTSTTMPAAWLVHYGHPVATSGTWYRAVVVVYTGLILLAGLGVSRLPERFVTPAGIALGVLVVAEAVWATSPLFPVPAWQVHLDVVEAIRDDPDPGALLVLPIEMDHDESQILMGTTAALPMDTSLTDKMRRREAPYLVRVERLVDEAVSQGSTSVLSEAGVGYVLLVETQQVPGEYAKDLERLLGEPLIEGDPWLWRVH